MKEDTLSAQVLSSCVKRLFSIEACAIGMAVYIAWNAEPSLYQRLTSLLSKGAAMLGDEVACPALEGVNSIWNSCVLNAVLHALKTISLCSQNGHVYRYRTAHQVARLNLV